MHESLPNTVDYIEMPSRDLAATKKFFSALFGWTFEDYGPDYAAFDDGQMTGGFFEAEDNWMSSAACPLVVFYSPELEMTRAEVVRLNGKVTRDIFIFPGGRRFHFQAPGSGEFAIWSDK
ncbi:MAG: VOC family protein [Chthoniobacterales bacterium]